ncbi:MAG TPA: hypothetical protein VL172_11345 [Kofleriaceae bacterium]|jgi:tetratricopeptide (TPR) repeat protein|nr:hypothetical protein [Kofleriaceae bacterium]
MSEGLLGRGVGGGVRAVGTCALAIVIACGGSGKGAEQPKGKGDGGGGGEVKVPPPAGDDDDTAGGDDTGGGNDGRVADNSNHNAIPPDKGNDGGGDPPPRPAAPAIKTSESAEKMSEFLVKPAKDAVAKRNWALAVTYYQALTEARGPASPEAYELVMRWVDAGEFGSAVDVLNEYIDTTPSAQERSAKLTVRDNLVKAGERNKFTKPFQQVFATADAIKVFDLGRKAFKAGKFGDAELYFRLGLRLDPNLKGFLRELGATYDKLGMRDKKVYYYRQYLTDSPFGANADFARAELAKEKGTLGKISLKSALPCDGGVWLNGKMLPAKLPLKELSMPPGRHGASCWNIGYEIYQIEWFDVEVGKTKNVTFNWAVVYNDLVNPSGRIFLENVTSKEHELRQLETKPPGVGIGVPVPADGHPMKYRLLSSDKTVDKGDLLIRIQPGEQVHIKWP